MRSRFAGVAALVLAAALMAGCAQVAAPAAKHYEPAHVETPAASTDPKVVTFTDEAARRAGVQTATVAQDGEWSVVPSAALIYEKTGASIVFVSPKPLTYQRVKVVVARDDGTRSWLSIGPAAGDLVVTVGVNQVWGAEQGVGH